MGKCNLMSPKRGPGFVIAWAAALGLMLLAATVLGQFAVLLVREQQLAGAARAALAEAALPRASTESVERAARRHLRGYPAWAAEVQTMTRVNGRLQFPRSQWQLARGDELKVSVGCLASSAAPDWLQCAGLSLDRSVLQATARRVQQ